jgi:hypothetical protein
MSGQPRRGRINMGRVQTRSEATAAAIHQLKAAAVWERSGSESDESVDESALLLGPGGGPGSCWRAAAQHADCQALSRRYWDAVIGMSSSVDLATAGLGRQVSGPLWEVSRAATDEELPDILGHFRDPRLRLRLHHTGGDGSAAPDADDDDDDDDDEVQVECPVPRMQARAPNLMSSVHRFTGIAACLRGGHQKNSHA